jgi:hypothetical protein
MEALPEFYKFRQRADPQVPLVYRDSGLSGYPQHYLGVGDLPITLNHSFASLMLFVHLHSVYVVPHSEKEGTKPPYVCPGCSNHMYSNNMITRFHVQ